MFKPFVTSFPSSYKKEDDGAQLTINGGDEYTSRHGENLTTTMMNRGRERSIHSTIEDDNFLYEKLKN